MFMRPKHHLTSSEWMYGVEMDVQNVPLCSCRAIILAGQSLEKCTAGRGFPLVK